MSDEEAVGVSRNSDPCREPRGLVGRGAVLYYNRDPEWRPCYRRGERNLAHVTSVYEETATGEVYFRVEDGTHTTVNWHHADDLLAVYEPAGWSCPTRIRPTHILEWVSEA